MHITNVIISALIVLTAVVLFCQFANLTWHIQQEIKAGQNGIYRGLFWVTVSLCSVALFTAAETFGVASVSDTGEPVTILAIPPGWIRYLFLALRLWLLATVAMASWSLFTLRNALKREE